MKTNRNAVLSQVMSECWNAMRVPIILNAATEVLTSTLLVVTANILGQFAEAALDLNWSLGIKNVVILSLRIFLTVFVAPSLGLIGNFSMLKHALQHDNIVFGHFFDKDPEKAIELDSGELQYELEDAPNELRIQMVIILSKAIAFPICTIYLLYCAGRISWLLTAIMLILAAVRLIIPMLLRSRLAKYDKAEKVYFRTRRGYEMDVTAAPHLIRLWGITTPILSRFHSLFEAYYTETGAKNDTLKSIEDQAKGFVSGFTQVFLFVAGAITVAKGYVHPGELISILVYLGVTQTILGNLGEIIQNYPLMKNAANRVSDFYSDPELSTENTIDQFAGLQGESLSLSFEDKEVLHDLSFYINSGDKVAVVGENGSGKTTFGKVIVSLINRYTGTIMVNGMDLKDLDVASWRKHIAYAPQTPYLFHTTVLDNICLGNPAVDRHKVNELMDAFGIAHLAERTVSMDSDLSGGERQKISIVRALMKGADLIVLDEPTNHLDQESIKWLQNYLLHTDKTIVVISHDEAMIETMNKTIAI